MNINARILATQLTKELISRAPVRDGAKYPGVRGASLYPGFLKNNAFKIEGNAKRAKVVIGGDAVPYAVYTEETSRKKGWIKESTDAYVAMLERQGWKRK